MINPVHPDDIMGVITARDGWRHAFLKIDFERSRADVSWWPIVGFATIPGDGDVTGVPVMTPHAPVNDSFFERYIALMDPNGTVFWRGKIFADSKEWFAAWQEREGLELTLNESGRVGPVVDQFVASAEPFNAAAFRPGAKMTGKKRLGNPMTAASFFDE